MVSPASTNEILASLKRQFPAHNVPDSALLHLVNGVSVPSLAFPKLTSLVASNDEQVINVPPSDVAELMSELQHKDPNMTIEALCKNLVRDDMADNNNYGLASDSEAERFCEQVEKCIQYLACVGLREGGAFGGRIEVPRWPFERENRWRLDKTIVLMGIGIFVAIIVVGELLGAMGIV